VKTRPDWCISRQRTWGVPIPAFYDAKGEAILDAQIVRNAADLIEKHGSNVWFEKSVAELWAAVKPKDWKGTDATAKSNDTLDVWIDSGSSSRAVLARRGELHHAVGTGSTPSQTSPQKDGDAVERVPTVMTLADLKFEPQTLLELISLVESKTISSSAAQQVFAEMFDTGKAPALIVQEKGLAQVSDTGAIEKFCDEAIAANPNPVADYKAGKLAALNSLKGQVMKLSKGKANPALVGEILERKLKA
jgi:hypothetical protein